MLEQIDDLGAICVQTILNDALVQTDGLHLIWVSYLIILLTLDYRAPGVSARSDQIFESDWEHGSFLSREMVPLLKDGRQEVENIFVAFRLLSQPRHKQIWLHLILLLHVCCGGCSRISSFYLVLAVRLLLYILTIHITVYWVVLVKVLRVHLILDSFLQVWKCLCQCLYMPDEFLVFFF